MVVLTVIVALMALIVFTRIPLGFNLMLCGIGGIAWIHPRGLPAAATVAQNEIVALAMNYQFSVLPLFLAMGVFVARAGLADDLFEAANRWLGRFRGGLGMATIASCAGFSSLSHNSAASVAIMGRLALPVMRKHGYDDSFSAGSVAAGGTLGLMIPPSGALIIYGLLTQTNLDGLFMAALVPASLQVVVYMGVIAAIAAFLPNWLPRGEKYSWGARLSSLKSVWGVLVLFMLIVLGIFFGWFTTTEAGGIGSGGALLFAILRRKMTWKIFVECLTDTAKTAGMIYFVASGAMVLNQFVNLAGIPTDVVNFIQSMHMSPIAVVFAILAFYLVLGMFLDGFAMIFLTVPVVVPVILGLGMDPIWWGVITIIVVELAMITPPVGLNCFVLKATLPEIPLTDIFRGILPFLLADGIRLVFLVLVPAAVLWLPSLM
ncbi:TRAP transporter large permease [Marinobacter bohaiensis]|uniref:TRAP transporter large permease n=1 Tax=Marinobacter bohaiensis TaxID=2201898 RepID=UPI000DADE9D9|nr:TRAP transporter large permease [Marinobacter bohaiensis]